MFLTGDIARAFTGLGSDLAHGISGLGRKIKRFGDEDDSQAPLPITPRFNPNAGGQDPPDIRGVEDYIAAAERGAREEYGDGLPDLPINRRDLIFAPPRMPAPKPAPSAS